LLVDHLPVPQTFLRTSDPGREEMAQRAYANQNAWLEVAAVLRWSEV
jgi:hypothetical protein